MSPQSLLDAAGFLPAPDSSVVSAESNWSFDFRRLVLAAALRGDLLDRLPLDPALFGSSREHGPKSPYQRIAAVLVEHHAKYGSRPSPEAFSQLVAEVGARLGPEERAVLEQEAADVLATDAPRDPAFVTDRVREQLERRAIERGLVQAAALLDAGAAAEQVRDVFAKASTPTNGAGNGLGLVPASTVEMEPMPWAWDKYIPRAAVTLIVGDPGENKTTFCADFAARVTTGRPFPDGAPGSRKPEPVIFLSAEDSTKYSLRARFEAMGGDSRLLFVPDATKGVPLFSLATDTARLEVEIRGTGALHVIIDPFNAYLPNVNTWKDNDLRAALAPLALLTARTDVTVLGVMHLNKKSDYSALQRVMGGIGNVAMSRATYLVARDPDNPNRRLFLNIKLNDTAKPPGLAFTLVPRRIQSRRGPIDTIGIAWDTAAPVTVTADELLQRSTKPPRPGEQATALIIELLKDGPVPATEMEHALAEAGISERTIDTAKKRAGAVSIKDPVPNGKHYWAPPGYTTTQRAAWMEQRRAGKTGEERQ